MERNRFTLTYKEIDGVTAIWFELDGRYWIVDPCALFNGMLNSDNQNCKMLYGTLADSSTGCWVEQRRVFDNCFWMVSKWLENTVCALVFGLNEYLEGVETCIDGLYADVVNSRPTVYDGFISLEEISKIHSQMKNAVLLVYSYSRSDINIEKFNFECPMAEYDRDDKGWINCAPFELAIGNRKISSFMLLEYSDIRLLRILLETFCYCGEARIELYRDDDPLVIRLRRKSSIQYPLTSGSKAISDNFVEVVIQSNLDRAAAIIGFCDEKETIKELYEGLLNIGRIGYECGEYELGESWQYPPIVFYNHIKSPIIERYLSGIKQDDDIIAERQRVIHHIFTISPDYVHEFGWMTGQSIPVGIDKDDVVTLKDEDEGMELCSVNVPGLFEWVDEFERLSDGVNSTMGKMNVEDWHRRGLLLAKELKSKLPDDIDLWYGYPFEDEEHRNSRPILITGA